MALYYYNSLSMFLLILLSCLSSIQFVSSTEAYKEVGLTIDLIHRDSPLSPSYKPFSTHYERLRSAFDRSFSRKSSIELARRRSSKTPHSFDASLRSAGGEFLMSFGIGTPPVNMLAIVDTGSDLTWIQCKPCHECYRQKTPLFDPKKSKTYARVPCSSQLCSYKGYQGASCSRSKTCAYDALYGDGSHVDGDVAKETFTFHSSGKKNAQFPGVAFGCGHSSGGDFEESSGIIGLGGGSISIVNQLKEYIGDKFSYCLTPLGSNVSSKISFGRNAVVTGPKVVSTPIVRKSETSLTFYFLTLEGISVGSKRFVYNPMLRSNSEAPDYDRVEGNIVIDSGTTLTHLPRSLYVGLESVLKKAIKGDPVADPKGSFQLCYRVPKGGKVNSPPITAHFRGADMVLPEESIFVEIQEGLACLTLVGDYSDMPIFGNLHQINYHVGYDLQNNKLNFVPTDCTKPL